MSEPSPPVAADTDSDLLRAHFLRRALNASERASQTAGCDLRTEVPAWLEDSISALTDTEAVCPAAFPAGFPFLPIAIPFLEPHRDALGRCLKATTPTRSHREAIIDSAFTRLAGQVDDMLARSVVLELNKARVTGELEGGTSEERYHSYTARFTSPNFRLQFFRTYPVLARQIAIAAKSWRQVTELLVTRLGVDQDTLDQWQGIPPNSREVAAIHPGAGDRHCGGQTVTKVTYSDGSQLVYKPRDGSSDLAFANFVTWVNGEGIRHRLHSVRSLDRDAYTWQETVPFAQCSEVHAPRFYYRQGALLALLYALGGTDVHSENLICAADVPYVVDLESLCQPELALYDVRLTTSEQAVTSLTTASVLRTGLLPGQSPIAAGGQESDVSGLGGRAGQKTPFKLPFRVDAGTDVMRIETSYGETGRDHNQPIEGDVSALLLRHCQDIEDGFADVYRILMRARAWLLSDAGSPLRDFHQTAARVLARHTAYYAVLHMASFHPDLLRDALDREKHYDFLMTESATVPALAAFVEHERADLWANDIPLFTAATTSRDVNNCRGQAIPGVIASSGVEQLEERIRGMSSTDLRQQLWLIRASVGVAAINQKATLTYPSYTPSRPAQIPRGSTSSKALIEHADRIGRTLSQLAFDADGEAEWLGVNSELGRNWSLGALGPDLYHGLTGVALFLATLSRYSENPVFSRLAGRSLVTAARQVDRGMLDRSNGLSGLPGYLLGVALCQRALDIESQPMDDGQIRRLQEAVSSDGNWDVSGGLAGTILCLSSLPTFTASSQIKDVARDAAARLADAQDPVTGGWVSQAMSNSGLSTVPLAGLAHGSAGICWALSIAASHLGVPGLEETIGRGLAYERTLFLPQMGNWKDVRDARILGSGGPLVAWCHGAAGGALARLGGRMSGLACFNDPESLRDIEAAIETTLADGVGHNHSLCHGDFGNTEIVLTVARMLQRPDWQERARLALRQSVDAGQRQGWLCGMPKGIETPGLMTGLAGVGYGLLRFADPTVPSMLLLGKN